MKERRETTVGRRGLLGAVVIGVAAALRPKAIVAAPAAIKPESRADKRKARYQANSAEVQRFYHVNRYPAQ
jgi:hypothetical protein